MIAPDERKLVGEVYRSYLFHRLYVPTGNITTGTVMALSWAKAMETVNNWNRLGQGTWVYWL